MPSSGVGWQPSRFLVDRAEAERAFQLAKQLGREGTRVERHKHRIQARGGWRPAALAGGGHGPLPNGFGVAGRHAQAVAGEGFAQRWPGGAELLGGGVDAARSRSPAELHQWVRRDEEYATLGANVVVELYSESHARKPTTRAWAIIRRADRSHRLASQRVSRSERRHAGRADRTRRSHQPKEQEMAADTR
jgi:hypothetical protein